MSKSQFFEKKIIPSPHDSQPRQRKISKSQFLPAQAEKFFYVQKIFKVSNQVRHTRGAKKKYKSQFPPAQAEKIFKVQKKAEKKLCSNSSKAHWRVKIFLSPDSYQPRQKKLAKSQKVPIFVKVPRETRFSRGSQK